MPLTAQDISEFRALYHKHYGVELNEADAREKAERLLRLVKAVWVVKSGVIQGHIGKRPFRN